MNKENKTLWDKRKDKNCENCFEYSEEDVREFLNEILERTTCLGCSKEYNYAFKTFRNIIKEIAGEEFFNSQETKEGAQKNQWKTFCPDNHSPERADTKPLPSNDVSSADHVVEGRQDYWDKTAQSGVKGCGKWLREDDSYGWINCGDKLDRDVDALKPILVLCDECQEKTS